MQVIYPIKKCKHSEWCPPKGVWIMTSTCEMKLEPRELKILVEEATNHFHELEQRNLRITRSNAGTT